MRRFAALSISLLFLTACASSRLATPQPIGVQISSPPAPAERFYTADIRESLAKAIAADFAKTIGPVDLNPQPGTVPLVSVSIVWERLGAPTSLEQQDIWFTLDYKLTTAAGVREGSIPAWGVKPSTYRTFEDDQMLVLHRAAAALRTAIQKAL